MHKRGNGAWLPFIRGAGHRALSQPSTLRCQVYAIALYVEAERAAKELGVRKRGGFFDDDRRVPFEAV